MTSTTKGRTPPRLTDPQAIIEAFRLIVGDGNVTECRILEATTASDRYPRTWFGYFDRGQALADAAGTIATAKGVFIIPNAVTDGWPDPVIADSGNGAHALYRIDLPADDDGIVQRCLQALAARFDDEAVRVDTSVCNAARIWKLYGTTAAKGDDLPERPWRMARIIDAPADPRPVPIELLQALANEIPTEATTAAAAPRTDHASGEWFDVPGFIRRHGLEVDGPSDWTGKQGKGRRWVFRQSPMCEHHEGAAHIEQHARGAITAGCHHNSCSWTWQDLRQRFDSRPVAQAKPPATDAAKPAAVRPAAHVELYRPFPVEALPEALRGFVQTAAAAMNCDPSYIALPLLVALAAAIGSTRRIILKRGWTEPAILWAAIVGESGTTKSPAFKFVMRPVRDLQRKALELHAEAMGQYETALTRYEKKLGEWKRAKGDSDPPDKPEQPQAVRYIVADTTVEALAPLLLANPRGLLLARDEMAGWFGSFDRYSGGGSGADAAAWLSMHSGESLIVDRKTGTAKTLFVPQAYVSLVGGIQPGILHRALGTEHRESGLAARLALIVHYARWAAQATTLQHPDRIDADSMARAVTLAQWFKGETRRVYGVLGESDGQAGARQLLEWIQRKGGAVSVRDLQQGPRGQAAILSAVCGVE